MSLSDSLWELGTPQTKQNFKNISITIFPSLSTFPWKEQFLRSLWKSADPNLKKEAMIVLLRVYLMIFKKHS